MEMPINGNDDWEKKYGAAMPPFPSPSFVIVAKSAPLVSSIVFLVFIIAYSIMDGHHRRGLTLFESTSQVDQLWYDNRQSD